jgi:hypothetical protein
MVITNNINLTTAMTAIAAINPNNAILKYHTPVLIIGGHNGNKIAPKTTTITPIPPRIVWSCVVS